MNGCHWIVCEHSSRWASALRVALQRYMVVELELRLREVRHLAELTSELAQRPASFVAIEVYRGNLADVLAWLATAGSRFPRSRCVALVDRSLSARQGNSQFGIRETRNDVCDALREAGALELAESPRQLGRILELGRRHAAIAQRNAVFDDKLPFIDRIWTSLPWQVT